MNKTTLLFAAARFASAVGRLCLGPFLPLLTEAFHFPDSAKPALLSSYSSGYILTQIIGGYLADQYGFAIVTSISVGLSAFILFYISSAAFTVVQWTSAFFILGILAGPLFPAGSAAISTCVPPTKRAASAAIIDASASAGTTVASLSPLIAVSIGWRFVYQATAVCLCFVAVAAWNLHDKIQRQSASAESRELLNDSKSEKVPTAALLHPASLCTYLCHFVDNFTKYSINSWASTMLFSKHGASLEMIGLILGCQEAVGVVSKVLVGVWFSSVKASFRMRGLNSAVAFLIQGLALGSCFLAKHPKHAAVCMIVSSSAAGAHSVGFRPIYFEASAKHAGAISGVGNTIASFASVLGPLVIGSSFDENSGNWWSVAMWMFVANILGAFFAISITFFGGKQSPSKRKE
ncbi:hypothetical protein ACA910_012658 [Epithemia clementina (nom. ined.)]